MTALRLSVELTDEQVDLIAARVMEMLPANQSTPEIMTVGEAADYMRCSSKRIYDLSSQQRIPVYKEGSRNLYKRSDLDRYLAGEKLGLAV